MRFGVTFRMAALAATAVVSLAAPIAARQTPGATAGPRSNAALQQFKTLAGEWEGTDSHGKLIHISYEALASGVVMERLQPQGEAGMITMYSLDGDHIVAIHFCSAGNQPVLKTGPITEANGKYNFQTERTYGLSSPEALHMVELQVTLTGNEHLRQDWTNLDHGKRSTNSIELARKK